MDWSGLTCLFTGPTSGFGYQAAKQIASKGARLILVGRRQERLQALLNELGGDPHRYIVADISQWAEVRNMAEQAAQMCDHIDLLVNSAAIGTLGPLFQTTSEQIERVIKTNLLGPMWCTRELLGLIDNAPRTGRTPAVVNVGSMTGRLALLGASDYSASRFGLVGFTEAAWKELAPKGIRTMMVNSGWIVPGIPGSEGIRGGNRWISWMVMDPSRVARAMIRGIERGRSEVRVQWWWHAVYHAAVLVGPLQRVIAKKKIKP